MAASPRTVCLHDKTQIEAFLRENTFLHLYELGDLEDRFWPFTTWYALEEEDQLQAMALVYSGLSVPTLLAFGGEEQPHLRSLVQSLTSLLPRRFFAHLSPGLPEILGHDYTLASRVPHYKMALTSPSRPAEIDTSNVVCLSEADAGPLCRFFAENYPHNWFNPRMLGTGQYFGLRSSQGFLSVAGVHVYSAPHRVAAIGNVATHAAHRGKGHATRVVAALCQNLRRTVDHVGLNVAAGNAPAIRCYERLGFEVIAAFDECEVVAAG